MIAFVLVSNVLFKSNRKMLFRASSFCKKQRFQITIKTASAYSHSKHSMAYSSHSTPPLGLTLTYYAYYTCLKQLLLTIRKLPKTESGFSFFKWTVS